MKAYIIAAALALLPASALAAPPAPAAPKTAEQASIPFVNSGSIRSWRVEDRDTLYVQDVRGKWYRGELMSNCFDLPFSETIGFETRGTNSFDRFSSIIVRGQRCPLKSLVASAPPPAKKKPASQG